MGKTIAYNPLSYPLYVMAKPVGALCNLDCSYCYYLEKEELYRERKTNRMTEDLLEKFTDEYIHSQTTPEVLFTWHGGETLLRGIDFYKKAIFTGDGRRSRKLLYGPSGVSRAGFSYGSVFF